MRDFTYHMPTRVVFGEGCLDTLKELCQAFDGKALIVTGSESARRIGALDRALAQLPDAAVFDGVQENPTTDTCERGAALCREKDCAFVVAIGGGSPMDAAKAIAVLVRNSGPCADYLGTDRVKNGALPIVAVPTTAGTGSEVTPYAVLVDTADASKKTICSNHIFPTIAVLDPRLTVSMPSSITANTGLDALSQAMEGMVAVHATPKGDVLALETCRIVKKWLPRAVADGTDIEARAQMLYAAMLSGCVIAQSRTTLVHGMGYYFTLEYGVAHGLANALFLTPVFQHNARCLPGKVAAIADALGAPCEPTPDAARKAITQAIHGLLETVRMSPAAKDAGVDSDRLDLFAREIYSNKGRLKNQPGDLSLEDVTRFFWKAYEG